MSVPGRAALAMLMLAAAATAHAQCKYKRLGAIPAEWIDSRLTIAGSINDKPQKMVVDTGAQWTTLSEKLATRLDVSLSHASHYEVGIGGKSAISSGRLKEFSVGRFQWHKLNVAVVASEGALPDVLVGADLLLENDVELDGKQMVFFTPSGCDDASLAYWADDVPWVPTTPVVNKDLRANIVVQVNGSRCGRWSTAARPRRSWTAPPRAASASISTTRARRSASLAASARMS